MLWPRPLLRHRARASVAFIRLFWPRPFSTPLCLILDYATYTCESSLIQDTEVIVFHYIFSWPTRKALKRRLLRPVSHGSDYIHTGAKRHRFAFTLSSMMAAQDFNFLLATDSYKVRITWLPSFDNRNTKARDTVLSPFWHSGSLCCCSRHIYVRIKQPTLTLWIYEVLMKTWFRLTYRCEKIGIFLLVLLKGVGVSSGSF